MAIRIYMGCKMWRLPGEFEQHRATWISWPCRKSIWPDIAATCKAYAAVVNAVAEGEPVNVLVAPSDVMLAKKLCSQVGVTFIPVAGDDSWARDTLPTFVVTQQAVGAVNWNFNAWGEKFFPFENDRLLGQKVIEYVQRDQAITVFEPGLVLEGGAIHSNGAGLLVTTKQALLNPNRNGNLALADMQAALEKYFHVQNIVWLEQGLIEDLDTDGHVDNVMCFADKDTVLMQVFNADDQNHAIFKDNLKALQALSEVVCLHQPEPVYLNGERLALSYANSYVANCAVIIPSFKQKKIDEAVYHIFKERCPGRDIIQIEALDILVGGGGIHCITMQEPKSV